jgi:hypothetical protein
VLFFSGGEDFGCKCGYVDSTFEQSKECMKKLKAGLSPLKICFICLPVVSVSVSGGVFPFVAMLFRFHWAAGYLLFA